ncbi:unnamed protein product [Paramecium octaurelia]|uniref:Uncharacterized protein n=1 Tax=Paramecium octaurelia TaxID=43137 RepID=A0A8S1S550_PAROT|nr:unnamed protein product [Paramecium octaurelia]
MPAMKLPHQAEHKQLNYFKILLLNRKLMFQEQKWQLKQLIKIQAQSQNTIIINGQSQATLVNNLSNECEMQDYVQLFFSKSQAGQNVNGQTKTNQNSVIIINNLGESKTDTFSQFVMDMESTGTMFLNQSKKYFQQLLINRQKLLLENKNKILCEAYESEIQRF